MTTTELEARLAKLQAVDPMEVGGRAGASGSTPLGRRFTEENRSQCSKTVTRDAETHRPVCKTPRCRNRARRGGLDCHRCHMRAWRASYPMRAAYSTLRDHARARDIEFSITFEYFERFARRCEYLERTGPFAQCLTVDRIDNRLGYIPGNIAPLSRAENARKRMLYDAARTRAGLARGMEAA